MIYARQINPDSGESILRSFPLLDVIPSEISFGLTGLGYIPVAYSWDFGDGDTSNKKLPSHTFNSYGSHRIRVSAQKNDGSWVIYDDDNHVILGKLDFEATPEKGDKPLLVTFSDASIAPEDYRFTGMIWDFGDTYGATGQQDTYHTYSEYGSYSVTVESYFEEI